MDSIVILDIWTISLVDLVQKLHNDFSVNLRYLIYVKSVEDVYRKHSQAVLLSDDLEALECVEVDSIAFLQQLFVMLDAVLHFTDARVVGARRRSIRRRLVHVASRLLLVETPTDGRLGEALETELRVLAQPALCDGGPPLHC